MSTAPPPALPPFHLAIPVHDIEAARHFYGEVLGLERGRSDQRWTDWNRGGHQVVTHQVDGPDRGAVAGTNPVDGHEVPVPHFGLVLSVPRFKELAGRLTAAGVSFVIEPYVRFPASPVSSGRCSSSTRRATPWSSRRSRTSGSFSPGELRQRRSPVTASRGRGRRR